jgi:hypothetical protein
MKPTLRLVALGIAFILALPFVYDLVLELMQTVFPSFYEFYLSNYRLGTDILIAVAILVIIGIWNMRGNRNA